MSLPAAPPLHVLGAVLLAGVIHAAWNALAKNFADLRDSFALFNLGVAATCLAIVPFVGFAEPPTLVFLGCSVAVHQLYELVLMAAYRHGDFSTSYPIARGSAPLLVSLGGLVFAHESLGTTGTVGLIVIAAGITLLSLRSPRREEGRSSVQWAVVTGVVIAVYTVVDGFGVRAGGSAVRYAVSLFLVQSVLWTIAVTFRRGWSWLPPARTIAVGSAGGVLSLVGYFIVLWAQTRAAMGSVSALRETGVLWASVIGVLFFREGRLRQLLPPAVLVVVGVLLLSLG